MRALALAVLLFAGHFAVAQTAPPVVPLRTANPNVVPLSTAPPWWSNAEFDRKITLVIKGVDLDAAIDALGRAANLSLIASGGSKARKKITLNLRDAPLRDAMLAVANLYDLTWFRTGKVYTLTYVPASKRTLGPPLSSFARPTPPKIRVVPSPYRLRTYQRKAN
ncbi:MAG TPA: STN domain-containing protein [Armatimonadota bacterium]|jgi:type II secretory pathway component GspD/PulD (secretin)